MTTYDYILAAIGVVVMLAALAAMAGFSPSKLWRRADRSGLNSNPEGRSHDDFGGSDHGGGDGGGDGSGGD